MYKPSHFDQPDSQAMCDLIVAAPLATLVIASPAGLVANHIPFILDRSGHDAEKLLAHIPRANPLSTLLAQPQQCLAIFHGPEGYISPSWYATKKRHGKVVPTWNYAVVHAHGSARIVDDPAWVRRQLDALTQQNENRRASPWAVTDAPADFIEDLVQALVGIEVTVQRMEGKTKASQNQPAENQASVLAAMAAQAPEGDLTRLMQTVLGDAER